MDYDLNAEQLPCDSINNRCVLQVLDKYTLTCLHFYSIFNVQVHRNNIDTCNFYRVGYLFYTREKNILECYAENCCKKRPIKVQNTHVHRN